MTQLTLRQFIDNLKSRGYTIEAIKEFVLNIKSEQAAGERPLWEWNAMLDAYLTARNYNGPESK